MSPDLSELQLSHTGVRCVHTGVGRNTQLEGARPRKSIPRPRLERAGGGGVGLEVTEIVVVAIGLKKEKMQTL